MAKRETGRKEVKARTRIVILGWYGSANTGDEAVLEATVSALRARGFHDLHVLSTNPGSTASILGVTSSRRSLGPETIRALWRARALVLGGGGLIQDGTSVYNLPLYGLFVGLARLFGLNVVCWGLGVEPLWTRFGKLLARFIVAMSSHFSVRDTESYALLSLSGADMNRVQIASDPAFLIPVSPARPTLLEPKRTVIFTLRALSDNHPGINTHYLLPVSVRKRLQLGWKPPREHSDALIESAAAGIEYCVNELGAHVMLLALWPGRDDTVAEEVRERSVARGVDKGAISIRSEHLRPVQIAEIVAGSDLLVSMRLHALVFAAKAGVPSVALQYARKMGGHMQALQMSDWVVEVDRHVPAPDELTRKIAALWSTRGEVSRALLVGAKLLQERAERDADLIAETL